MTSVLHICCGCQIAKDAASEFYHRDGRPKGKCKQCRRELDKLRYTNAPSYFKQKTARWRGVNKDKTSLYRRQWLDANPTYYSERNKKIKADKKSAVLKLKDNPCKDCGGRFNRVCMDFDHAPSTPKKADISSLMNGPEKMSVLLKEISKCDLVCANCHRIRTAKRMGVL